VSASVVAVVDNEAVQSITTPGGDARAVVSAAAGPVMTLVLGHGAGGGIGARDLVALAETLPPRGVTVVRVVQPWRVAGRKVAGPPATLDRAWLAALEALDVAGPFVVGGRSAGARVACRTASQVGAIGCLALAFPLHPPGRPETSRLDELLGAGVPTLVVQGERDAFGGPKAFPRKRSRYVVRSIPGADHSFRVPAGTSQPATLELVSRSVREWLLRLVP
jgi:predicted alpha/beta-hydrolase family hydrolase